MFSYDNQLLWVTKDSIRYDYNTQVLLVKKIIEHSDLWSKKNISLLFLRVVSELLKLCFSPTEAGRGRKIIFYTVPVKYVNGSKEYREIIWNSLSTLYDNDCYKAIIETIVREYGQCFGEKIDKKMAKFDIQYVMSIFKDKFSSSILSHCIIAKDFSDKAKHYNKNIVEQLSSYLNSPDYLIYSILRGERQLKNFDYEKEKEHKQSEIRKFVKNCNQDKIMKIIKVCVDLEKCNIRSIQTIQEGLPYLLECLAVDRELYLFAIKFYLSNNTPLGLKPDNILNKLFEVFGDKKTYEIIDKIDYCQKNFWQFSFYKNLPIKYISKQYVKGFYDFLSLKEETNNSFYRDIGFLENYIIYDNQVFIKASKLILKKYEYSPRIFSAYFEPMLFPEHSSPEILIKRFNKEFDLLKDMYFKMISYDESADYNGNFLITFLNLEPSFIDEYIESVLCRQGQSLINSNWERLSVFWDSENYMELADKIINKCLNQSQLRVWEISHFIGNILRCSDCLTSRIQYQENWISHCIDLNFNNIDLMKILFASLKGISQERKKNHILHLVRLNSDPEFFILQMESTNWEWSGDRISLIQSKIDFLKTLLPGFIGLEYLIHKQRIENDIVRYKKLIEEEQINEVLRGF